MAKKLFLLEDDLSLISGLTFAIQKQGYEIDVARTTAEAESLWDKDKYNMAILDVSLPDGSGFTILTLYDLWKGSYNALWRIMEYTIYINNYNNSIGAWFMCYCDLFSIKAYEQYGNNWNYANIVRCSNLFGNLVHASIYHEHVQGEVIASDEFYVDVCLKPNPYSCFDGDSILEIKDVTLEIEQKK